MSEAVLLLRLEHANQAKLLRVIDEKVQRLDQGKPVDLDLVASIIDYCQSFGGTCHHPKEDLLFHAIQARDPAAAESFSALLEEHKELERLTRELAGLVANARNRTEPLDVRLVGALEHYRDFYSRHMEMEKKHFFPAALRVLTDNDWESIEFDLFDDEDPLFSDVVENRYDKLRERLVAQA